MAKLTLRLAFSSLKKKTIQPPYRFLVYAKPLFASIIRFFFFFWGATNKLVRSPCTQGPSRSIFFQPRSIPRFGLAANSQWLRLFMVDWCSWEGRSPWVFFGFVEDVLGGIIWQTRNCFFYEYFEFFCFLNFFSFLRFPCISVWFPCLVDILQAFQIWTISLASIELGVSVARSVW